MSDTAVAIIENPAAITAFDQNNIDEIIKAVRTEATSLVADVSTKKGRDELKSQAYKVSQTKTHLVKLANASISKHKDIVKAVTSERVRLEKELDAIRDETKAPAVEWETEEESRKESIKQRIERMRYISTDIPSLDLKELGVCVKEVEEIFNAGNFAEFDEGAGETYHEVKEALMKGIEAREKYEAEQAELKRLREAEEKRKAEEVAKATEEARKAAELKAAQEAKEKAEREAKEVAEREARRKAEEDRRIKEAEERAKRQERERIEREQREKAEAEARAAAKIKADQEAKEREEANRKADEKHRAKIRKEIADELAENGVKNTLAANIVLAIESGAIPHVSINF